MQFSPHTLNWFVPHVMTVRTEADIGDYLARALDGRISLAQARDDGARFIEALRQSCFDMGTFLTTRDTGYGASHENATVAYRGLLESLEPPVSALSLVNEMGG